MIVFTPFSYRSLPHAYLRECYRLNKVDRIRSRKIRATLLASRITCYQQDG